MFRKHCIEIQLSLKVIQNVCGFFSSILSILVNCFDFLTFACYKETNGISIYKMMSALTHLRIV